jgi:alpha-amylase
MIGGAYYEAILSIIPDEDKRDQLQKLSKELRRAFGVEPQGMWLAERVWEQHLARHIADAGLQYIAVDDTHFKYAGLSDYELLGYYMTEELGRTLAIFPISKKLRYTIPFQPVQKTIDYLREVATEEGDRVVVYADDGEKFGVWPKTYEHVYGSRWLEEFFQALSDHRDWIRVRLFSEVLHEVKPIGRIYLPNASYAEMLHWVLRPRHFIQYEELEAELKNQGKLEKVEPFFKGGFWRNFLVKYPEINTMHKKMLRVSQRVRALQHKKGSTSQIQQALEHLWAAQCNDPYWHGVFGGFYLPVLRYPIFRNLIAAEKVLDKIEKRKSVNIEITDFDCDGSKEVLVESPLINCYLKPDQGGSMFELDFKPISLNLLDVVTRREEGYHKKLSLAKVAQPPTSGAESIHDVVLTKEEGLDQFLHYDWYRRASLIDHFFGATTTLERVYACNYQELGNFVNQPYDVETTNRGGKVAVQLTRNGTVWRGEIRHGVRVQKCLRFSANDPHLVIEYSLSNLEKEPIDLWFGIEFNIGLQAGDAHDRYYYVDGTELSDRRLRSMGEVLSSQMIGLRDEWLGVDVRIETSKTATFWRFPIETISLSEEGFERVFQSSVVIPHWRFRLEKEWKLKLVHRISRLRK